MKYTALLLFCLTPLWATKGPQKKSLRALSMGNAFVAVAENREAIYYNPSGLNLINKLGNYEVRPDLGYYPNNYLDMNIDGGIYLFNGLGTISKANEFTSSHKNTFKGSKNEVLEQVSNDSTLYDDFLAMEIDRHPFPVGGFIGGEFAFHNFGGAIWSDVIAKPYVDAGILTPRIGIDNALAVIVGQLSFAFELNSQWSLGASYKLIFSNYLENQEFGMNDLDIISDSIKTIIDEKTNLLVSNAIDLGANYQWKREIRFGMALQNIFLGKFNNETITPELTVGINYSPRKWQRNTAYARKVNMAFDLEDLLNNDKNYKFFSKVNFGVEVDQVLLAWPSLGWAGNLRVLRGRLATGFKGGYWTAGAGVEVFRLIHLEIATWAEEGGYFTGQEEQRSVVFQIGGGF